MAAVRDTRFQAGDRVILRGYPPTVPMRLAGSRATVEATTARGLVIVKADDDAYGTRRVRPYMIGWVLKGGEWVLLPS